MDEIVELFQQQRTKKYKALIRPYYLSVAL